MTSPTPSPNDRTPNPDSNPVKSPQNQGQDTEDDLDFGEALQEVEQSLGNLKQRYLEVEQNQALQGQLRERAAQLKQELRRTPSYERSRRQPLRDELRHIQEQLDTIELNLESQLFSFSSLKEPFWQAVRFGGLGIVIGWILKSCAG
jgi:chromosome segregation ATPase